MAGADAAELLAATGGDVEEAAAPLIPGPGGASASATGGAPSDVLLLSSAFLFVFLAYHAAQNLQSTVNTVCKAPNPTPTSRRFCSGAAPPETYASSSVAYGGRPCCVARRTRTWAPSRWACSTRPSRRSRWWAPRWCGGWAPGSRSSSAPPATSSSSPPTSCPPGTQWCQLHSTLVLLHRSSGLGRVHTLHQLPSVMQEKKKLPEGPTLGSFNGEFWGMFASTQVIGNLISLALLRNGKDGETVTGKNLLFAVFLGCMIVGIVLMCLLSKRDEKRDNTPTHSSLGVMLKYIIAPLKDQRMLLTIPLIAYSGLQQAFVWAVFTKSIVTPVLGVSGVGGAMAIYGAADVVCSLVVGRLTSGLRSAAVIVSVGAILQAIVLFWLLLFYSPMDGLLGAAIPLLIGALWGVGDGVLNTQLSSLLGLLFEDVKEAAFAQLKVWQSGAIAVTYFLSPSITLEAMLTLMAAGLVISYGSFLFLTLVVEKPSPVIA